MIVPKVKKLFCIFFPAFVLFCGGNPHIVRYLEPAQASLASAGANPKDTIDQKYKIFEKDGLTIYLKNAAYKDIEQTAKADVNDDISFRIPQFTFLEFFIDNKSGGDVSVNLFSAQLTDSEDNPVPIFLSGEFTKNYTSVAYANFHYEKIFSFYITHYKDAEPKKGFFYEKFSPGKIATVKPGYSGLQIIPFSRISERSLKYTLTLSAPGLVDHLEIPLKYIIKRLDRP
jgi:hypothetical protein